jgi:transketolase
MSRPALHESSWHLHTVLDQAPGLKVLAETLADLVDEGHPIVAGTADLKYSNGLWRFQERHPDRFTQFGISEQNMVTAAAGMATTGLVPFVSTFASFLALLCCEQIRTDVAYTGLPVRLIGHHAGITLGFYGTSHHATEDLAIMRSLAGLIVLAPADAPQLAAALRATAALDAPMYIRIGRGREPDVYPADVDFQLGRAIVHDTGADLTIIATGSMVGPALGAARELRGEGRAVGVIDMHTIKPLDAEAVLQAAAASRALMTVEEHSVVGGLGGAVAEVLADAGSGVRLHRHGIQDTYSLIGPPTHLYRHYGLDVEGIAARARDAIGAGDHDPEEAHARGPEHGRAPRDRPDVTSR